MLRQYAVDNNYSVVDEYIDEGVSARKPYTARPELLRLLSDVQAHKIDLILFAKLDRWFRNVKEYYKVEEILESNNVSWSAVQEDYETITSSGRFKINILLAVAEDEADRTAERVKFIMDRKRAKGEVVGAPPYGYRVEDKRAVIVPEQAENVRKLFQMVLDGVPRSKILHAFPDWHLTYNGLRYILTNTSYIGEKSGVVFPPIIDESTFNRVQDIQEKRCIPRETRDGRVYMFSGLLICPICGSRLAGSPGTIRKKDGQRPQYYRCPKYVRSQGECTFTRKINEVKVEGYLLDHVKSKLQATIKNARKGENKTHEEERKAVKRKIKRLNELYIDGNIDKDEYDRRKKALDDEYGAIPLDQRVIDTNALKEQFFPDWKDLYEELPKKSKQTFWSQTIDRIELNKNGTFKTFKWRMER